MHKSIYLYMYLCMYVYIYIYIYIYMYIYNIIYIHVNLKTFNNELHAKWDQKHIYSLFCAFIHKTKKKEILILIGFNYLTLFF